MLTEINRLSESELNKLWRAILDAEIARDGVVVLSWRSARALYEMAVGETEKIEAMEREVDEIEIKLEEAISERQDAKDDLEEARDEIEMLEAKAKPPAII